MSAAALATLPAKNRTEGAGFYTLARNVGSSVGISVVTALLTVAILALIGPYLLNVDLPHGLVGDWLIDKLALRAS